ncbi:hypothetical protein ACJJTC_006166 [Scirpophaga incertulas]
MKLRDAASAYKALNGLVCIYKPTCVSVERVLHCIRTNLCRDLNGLPDRPGELRVAVEGPTNKPMTVKLVPNYADDPLVCGPRYIAEDIKCSWATHLGLFSSGVLLVGLNQGTKLTYLINTARLTRCYKISGLLGKATDTYFWNGKLIEKATIGHVTRPKIDEIVAHMQAAHQKTMFELSGVHMESQTMFDLASEGLIRPANSKLPVIYGLKCVAFDPPHFTLEVQAVNEYEKYLWTLIHDLGIQLKTAAHCTGVQCIRQGKFDVSLALLRKHWKLEHFIDNMDQCRIVLEEHEQLMRPESAILSG